NPESIEPLGVFAGSQLDQFAQAKKLNFVAHLTDSMYLGAYRGRSKPVGVEGFAHRLTILPWEVKQEAGWLLVGPKRPVEARSVQVKRDDLLRY
ncbi:hypothetical protein, partial [Salmonella enterica]|uniref:hypothetical protein n=1 Tax=Salmonella enterica TaxID=28901 RepID=UPI0030B64524